VTVLCMTLSYYDAVMTVLRLNCFIPQSFMPQLFMSEILRIQPTPGVKSGLCAVGASPPLHIAMNFLGSGVSLFALTPQYFKSLLAVSVLCYLSSMNAPEPPTWLMPPQSVAKNDRSKAVRDLEVQTWAIAFETILERLSEGVPFDTICKEYHAPLSPARVRTWIFSNERRRNAYVAAKAIGAESVEDDLLRIADGLRPDGTASLDDVPRSQLRIQTRKWLLQVWNRDRYGDVKKVEQTTTTRLNASAIPTDELRSRLLRSLGVDTSTVEDADYSMEAGDTGE
jgi:hypothetical protein